MTTVIGMICSDGLVIGSDTKVTSGGAVEIKTSENKLVASKGKVGSSLLVIGGSGTIRHIRDAIGWMEIDNLDDTLGRDNSFNNFLDLVVEHAMPKFVRNFHSKYDEEPDFELLIGCIDENKKPKLIQVFPDGDYDHLNEFAASGSGSIFGEILLRKLYYSKIPVAVAEKFIGYIIWEIQEIDNESGENMQIMSLTKDGELHTVSPLEIESYKQLPKIIQKPYDLLKKELVAIDIGQISSAVEVFQNAIGEVKDGKAN